MGLPLATTAQVLSGTSLAVRRAQPGATLARPRLMGCLPFRAAESWNASRSSEAKCATAPPRAPPQARRVMIRSMEGLLWHAAMVMSVSRFLAARCAPLIVGSDRALPCCAKRVFYLQQFRMYARGALSPRQQCAGKYRDAWMSE